MGSDLKTHLELQREITLIELAPSPYFFVLSICLAYMNVFSRFDENPALTLQDIKETKHYGQTDARTDNVKTAYPPQTKFEGYPPQTKFEGYPPQTKFAGGIITATFANSLDPDQAHLILMMGNGYFIQVYHALGLPVMICIYHNLTFSLSNGIVLLL